MSVLGLFKKKKKEKEEIKEESRALSERKNAGLPVRPEKKRGLTETERRTKALERRKNPEYAKPYEPFVDPVEADEEVVRNERYEKVASRFRFAKWVAVILLIAYSFFMIITYRDLITMENFRYLIRNVDLDIETGIKLENRIVYDADPDNIYVRYRDYTAVVNKRGLKIFDKNGRTAYSEDAEFSSPAVCTSSKYMLVYDRKGEGYSVYSYFNRESTEKVDFTVSAAALSDGGSYALATRSTEYDGVVYIYNASRKLIKRIQKNRTVGALAMNENGDELLIAAYGTDGEGRLSTELSAIPTGEGKNSRVSVIISDVIPYECGYSDDGGFYLICADGIRSFDENGKQRAFFPFGGTGIKRYVACGGGFLLLTPGEYDSGLSTLTLLEPDCSVIYKHDAGRELTDISLDGKTVYLLYPDRLTRINENGESGDFFFDLPVQVKRVIAEGGNALIFTSAAVLVPDFGESGGA